MIQTLIILEDPVRIGCAGWSIARNAAPEFPLAGTHLQRYAQVFNSCEINSSFYRTHKEQTWRRWAGSVPAEFRFSVKAPKTITHEAGLNCDPEVLLSFVKQTGFLGEKLGPVLFQLPPSLEFDLKRAQRFISTLRKHFSGDVVWEPRHASWFGESPEELLRDYQISRVAADPACVPAAANPGGFVELSYFRLHGSPRRYHSAYSGDFLNDLASQMAKLAERARIWCMFDNTAHGFAIPNALQLRSAVEVSTSS